MKAINFEDDSQLWDVVILDDQGEWKTLKSALSYKEADDEVEQPFGAIDRHRGGQPTSRRSMMKTRVRPARRWAPLSP